MPSPALCAIGNEIGRTIGFPTANISVVPHILLPANGVYAALTTVDGKVYPSILNIGLRPTIEKRRGADGGGQPA